jgi:glycosyltransferase involved in cell wall biosynthesis
VTNIKLSIITVCYNSDKTIRDTIESVLSQKLKNFEYIIVDGDSSDNTLKIISDYKKAITTVISEKDSGIYDAINKGIQMSTGNIIGILNSDDIFADDMVLSNIYNHFSYYPSCDAIIADVHFINDSGRTIRKYSSKNWNIDKFKWGSMPPHPSFYCKKELFDIHGFYSTSFKIASDYELLIRFMKVNSINFMYLPIVIAKMKLGGISTKGLSSTLLLNKEIYMACKMNNIKTNFFYIYSKYFKKIFEFSFFK